MELPKSIKPTLELALNRVHPEDLSLVREMVDRSAREGGNLDFETRLLMPDETVKHVHIVLQNIGQPGKPELVGAVTDISQRKRGGGASAGPRPSQRSPAAQPNRELYRRSRVRRALLVR